MYVYIRNKQFNGYKFILCINIYITIYIYIYIYIAILYAVSLRKGNQTAELGNETAK